MTQNTVDSMDRQNHSLYHVIGHVEYPSWDNSATDTPKGIGKSSRIILPTYCAIVNAFESAIANNTIFEDSLVNYLKENSNNLKNYDETCTVQDNVPLQVLEFVYVNGSFKIVNNRTSSSLKKTQLEQIYMFLWTRRETARSQNWILHLENLLLHNLKEAYRSRRPLPEPLETSESTIAENKVFLKILTDTLSTMGDALNQFEKDLLYKEKKGIRVYILASTIESEFQSFLRIPINLEKITRVINNKSTL